MSIDLPKIQAEQAEQITEALFRLVESDRTRSLVRDAVTKLMSDRIAILSLMFMQGSPQSAPSSEATINRADDSPRNSDIMEGDFVRQEVTRVTRNFTARHVNVFGTEDDAQLERRQSSRPRGRMLNRNGME